MTTSSTTAARATVVSAPAPTAAARFTACKATSPLRSTTWADWLARSITGEGIAPAEEKDAAVRFYRRGNSAPGFACSANNHLPSAWNAVKAMLALGKVSDATRTPAVRAAIETGSEFLLSRDPAVADYLMGYATKPSQGWLCFGYPIAYVTDILQMLVVLTTLGYGGDAHLRPALALLLSKQEMHGR